MSLIFNIWCLLVVIETFFQVVLRFSSYFGVYKRISKSWVLNSVEYDRIYWILPVFGHWAWCLPVCRFYGTFYDFALVWFVFIGPRSFLSSFPWLLTGTWGRNFRGHFIFSRFAFVFNICLISLGLGRLHFWPFPFLWLAFPSLKNVSRFSFRIDFVVMIGIIFRRLYHFVFFIYLLPMGRGGGFAYWVALGWGKGFFFYSFFFIGWTFLGL